MLNKINLLLGATGLAAAVLLIKILTPPHALPQTWSFGGGDRFPVRLEAFKQPGSVTDINDSRDTTKPLSAHLDRITFGNHDKPKNSVFAEFGLLDNFYADFRARFSLDAPAPTDEFTSLFFAVHSDDGFSLRIDGREIAAHPLERPYEETEAAVKLEAGEHSLELLYFQGGGGLGLDAYYRFRETDAWLPVGEDSARLKFLDAPSE